MLAEDIEVIRTAGVVRVSFLIALVKSLYPSLEEYMDKRTVNNLLNLLHEGTGGRVLTTQAVKELLGSEGLKLPGIIFLVSSSCADHGGFLKCPPGGKYEIPKQYHVDSGKNNIDCPELREAVLPFLKDNPTVQELKKLYGNRIWGYVRDPVLYLSMEFSQAQFQSLKSSREYVLVGTLHVHHEASASPMSWPTSQESFFPFATVLSKYPSTCLNFARAYGVLHPKPPLASSPFVGATAATAATAPATAATAVLPVDTIEIFKEAYLKEESLKRNRRVY